MSFDSIESKICNEIEKSLQSAIDQKHGNIVRELLRFIINRALKLRRQSRVDDFTSYLNIYKYTYQYSKNQKPTEGVNKDFNKTLSDLICSSLRNLFDDGYKSRSSLRYPVVIEYEKLLIDCYSALINLAYIYHDFNFLKRILNNLRLIAYFPLEIDQHLLREIRELSQIPDRTAAAETELVNIDRRYKVRGEVRLLLKATYFWSFFLYGEGELKVEEIKEIMELFDDYRESIGDEFLPDLIYMRNAHNRSAFSWSLWDYIEREDMVVYTPPRALNWETTGAAIFLILYPNTLSISRWKEELLSSENWLILHSLKVALNKATYDIGKWIKLMPPNSEEEYLSNVSFLRSQIELFETERLSDVERAIAAAELDAQKIAFFELLISQAYQKSSILFHLFNHFDAIEIVPVDAPNQLETKIGFVDYFWVGSKRVFLSENDNGMTFTGESQILWVIEDAEFIEFFMKPFRVGYIETSNPIDELKLAIKKLNNHEFAASIILCGENAMIKSFPEIGSYDLFSRNNMLGNNVPIVVVDKFQDIPVVMINNPNFRDYLLVTDFRAAFRLRKIRTENQFGLTINVTGFTEEEIHAMLAQGNKWQKFGDDAALKIANSLKLNCYLSEEFTILNPDAFTLIRVN